MGFSPSSHLFAAAPMGAGGDKVLHAVAQFQAHAFKAAMRYQVEALAFLKHRCEVDMKLMDDLAGSGEFQDAFDVLGNYAQNAVAEYAREAGKFASIGSRLASETARRVREEASGAIEDMAARTVA